MKRAKIIVLSVAALIVIVAAIILGNHFFVKPNVVNQDYSLALSVENDEKTSGFFGFTASLPWESGEMKIHVNSSDLYDDLNDISDISDEDKKYIENNHFFTEVDKKMFGELDFMLVDITLENVSAELGKDDMLMNFFQPYPYDVFYGDNDGFEYYISESVYFDKHKPLAELAKVNYKSYFSVSNTDLEQGKSYQFKLGFYIDEKTAESNNIILNIGTGNHNKYGIELDLKENTND